MNKLEKLFKDINKKYGTVILSKKELSDMIGWKSNRLNMALLRLIDRERLTRAATGYYRLSYLDNWKWQELINKIDNNCYLSGKYILKLVGIYIGNVDSIDVITSKKQNRYIMSERGLLKFRKDANYNLKGVKEDMIAKPEKAFVDYLRLELATGNKEIEFTDRIWNIDAISDLNWDMIKEYADMTKKSVQATVRRLRKKFFNN